MAVTEVSIGYQRFLSHKGRKKFRTPGTFCDSKLFYPDRLRRMLNLVHRQPDYVLQRLFDLAFPKYDDMGGLPLDCNNEKNGKSILGIIRCELDDLPAGIAVHFHLW